MEKNIFIYISVSQLWDGIMTAYTVTPLSPLLSFSCVSYLPRQFTRNIWTVTSVLSDFNRSPDWLLLLISVKLSLLLLFFFFFSFSVSTEMGSIAL